MLSYIENLIYTRNILTQRDILDLEQELKKQKFINIKAISTYVEDCVYRYDNLTNEIEIELKILMKDRKC